MPVATKAQIQNLRLLSRDAAHRAQAGQIAVEGETLIREAQGSGWLPVELYARADQESAMDALCAAWGVPGFTISSAACERAADTKSPKGMLGIFARPAMDLWPAEPATILAMECVQDPGNVGALLRAAEAAGVQAVLQCDRCCDPYSPKAIRAAMGSAFRLPLRRCANLLSAIADLRQQEGHTVVGSALCGDNLYRLPCPEKFILLVGNEAGGLTQPALDSCDALVRIPMGGRVESLNAAVAGGILLYHLNGDRVREM